MTEAEWIACTQPQPQLEFLRGKVSDRKLRLFACASCRNIWECLPAPECRAALELAERYADGWATNDELQCVAAAVMANLEGWAAIDRHMVEATVHATAGRAFETSAAVVAFFEEYASLTTSDGEDFTQKVAEASQNASRFQATLLRHIFNNPFRPYSASPSWPAAIVSLAEAVYNGANATFALHDALLEAGHPDLAEHFQAEQWHPKGCWVVDLILGKT
jgi:hypothetical protein